MKSISIQFYLEVFSLSSVQTDTCMLDVEILNVFNYACHTKPKQRQLQFICKCYQQQRTNSFMNQTPPIMAPPTTQRFPPICYRAICTVSPTMQWYLSGSTRRKKQEKRGHDRERKGVGEKSREEKGQSGRKKGMKWSGEKKMLEEKRVTKKRGPEREEVK